MTDTEGLIMPDGTFRSKAEIVADNYVPGEVIHRDARDEPFDFERWQEIVRRRQEERMEFEAYPSEVEIEIPTDRPVAVAFMGDTHVGGMYNDYEMMADHVRLISEHPLMYATMQGDLIDGFFFNPAQDGQILSLKEQDAFARAMLKELNGKLLYATVGDHDSWSEKMGAGFYRDFTHKYGASLLRGSSIVHLKIGDVIYDIVTAHQLPGHSMYNNAHPEQREARFGLQGADLYVAGHTHRKGANQHFQRGVEGGKRQLFVSTGPYKYSDEYAMKKGYGQQAEQERGAVWVMFDHAQRKMIPFWSAKECADAMGQYLR